MASDAAHRAEFRTIWRRNWLECIAEFSDYNLQQKSWLGSNDGSPYWTFVEWMCRYFDDQSLSEGYDQFVVDAIVTKEEVNVVSAFHLAASSYDSPTGDDYDHAAILEDPAWKQVVALADSARLRLLEIISDMDEQTILRRHER